MTSAGFALFDTALGRCAIAWGDRGIVGVQLPEANDARTRRRMQQRFRHSLEGPPTPAAQRAIDAIVALLGGQAIDLREVPIDLDGHPEFDRRVFEIARGITPGRTLTYGDVAARLGDASLARAVGRALGRNPFALIVPCHRVLAANGRLGGFSASGGAVTKRRLLLIEGARTSTEPGLFDGPPEG